MTSNSYRRKPSMIRIAMPWVIDASSKFDELGKLDDNLGKLDIYYKVLVAKAALEQLYLDSIYRSYFRVSSQKAGELATLLEELTAKYSENPDADFETWRIVQISSSTRTFHQILKSELGALPSFLVLPKGGYDVGFLTEQGEAMFPTDTAIKVPGTLVDMKEAAKALAYDLPTACGFHTFRVLESVLRSYWTNVSGGKGHPASKTIGIYAESLKKDSLGEAKVWEVHKQIKDLHRNPLAHPEVILSAEEAIGVIGIAFSAISEMLRVLPDAPSTTTNPPQVP